MFLGFVKEGRNTKRYERDDLGLYRDFGEQLRRFYAED